MRLPHHLTQEPSGIFYFRLTVPKPLREVVGKREIWKSLHTKDPAIAKAWAYMLSARYLGEFRKMKPKLEDVLRTAKEGQRYELELPNGMKIRADDEADHLRAMQMLDRIEDIGIIEQSSRPPALPAAPAQPPAGVKPEKLSKAIEDYLPLLKATAKPKTYVIKKGAFAGFEAWIGGDTILHTIGRTDLYNYLQHLFTTGLAKPTITNKFIYLKGFFDAMQSAGLYPEGTNPAEGHISMTDKDRNERAKLGAEPFTDADVNLIFSPGSMTTLRRKGEHNYWAALVSVYTGARVNEICQLETLDFRVSNGLQCVEFSDAGGEQSIKTGSSKREVPLPQALLDLGFWDYVKEQEKAGRTRIFPKLKTDGLNGPGDAVSKAFNRHVKSLGIKARTGRKTFHSFRDTVIVKMQDALITPLTQAAITGHELKDAHFVNYSRSARLQEMKDAMDKSLNYAFLPALLAEKEAEELRKLLPKELRKQRRRGF